MPSAIGDRGAEGRPRAAVIGSGISGLTAAHLLRTSHEVTLYEADGRLGGHAHTHNVPTSDGGRARVDSAFIVHNRHTYPYLCRLFAELGVRTQESDMSMSVSCDGCGLSYAGGRGLAGLLARPRQAVDARFVRMLGEIPRFHRLARAALRGELGGGDVTWGQFLTAGRFTPYFVRHFAIPLVSCVWSSGADGAAGYPARHLFQFLDHHGMLQVTGSPTWRTVIGGSAGYVAAVARGIGDIRTLAPVTAIARHDDGVDVRCADGSSTTFDRAIVATHADDALAVLVDASPDEKADLASFRYTNNHTWLHRDGSVLPRHRRARASWNLRMPACSPSASGPRVSYWMNRLQRLRTDDDLVVTLNPQGWVDPSTVIASMTYRHPVFTRQAVAAAPRLAAAGGARLAFAGAHLGWGFHEDGCRSAVEAVRRLGVPVPW